MVSPEYGSSISEPESFFVPEQPVIPSERIIETVEGAIGVKIDQQPKDWTMEARGSLHMYLAGRLAQIEEAAYGRWNDITTTVESELLQGVRKNVLSANIGDQHFAIRASDDLSGITNNNIAITSAVLLTRSTFMKALEYMQHGVTNEKELREKKKKGSSYTRSGKGKSGNFRF